MPRLTGEQLHLIHNGYSCVCGCCLCTWRSEDHLRQSSGASHLVFLKQSLSLVWSSLSSLGWLASKAQASTCLCHPSTGTTTTGYYTSLRWVLGTKFRSLYTRIARTLRLSHLPSPTETLFSIIVKHDPGRSTDGLYRREGWY